MHCIFEGMGKIAINELARNGAEAVLQPRGRLVELLRLIFQLGGGNRRCPLFPGKNLVKNCSNCSMVFKSFMFMIGLILLS
jgi:hypothetical protein